MWGSPPFTILTRSRLCVCGWMMFCPVTFLVYVSSIAIVIHTDHTVCHVRKTLSPVARLGLMPEIYVQFIHFPHWNVLGYSMLIEVKPNSELISFVKSSSTFVCVCKSSLLVISDWGHIRRKAGPEKRKPKYPNFKAAFRHWMWWRRMADGIVNVLLRNNCNPNN